jgi:hypothetical protein
MPRLDARWAHVRKRYLRDCCNRSLDGELGSQALAKLRPESRPRVLSGVTRFVAVTSDASEIKATASHRRKLRRRSGSSALRWAAKPRPRSPPTRISAPSGCGLERRGYTARERRAKRRGAATLVAVNHVRRSTAQGELPPNRRVDQETLGFHLRTGEVPVR